MAQMLFHLTVGCSQLGCNAHHDPNRLYMIHIEPPCDPIVLTMIQTRSLNGKLQGISVSERALRITARSHSVGPLHRLQPQK